MTFDFKNVQRRVYDALNVLHALGMITKDRNKIVFIRDTCDENGRPFTLNEILPIRGPLSSAQQYMTPKSAINPSKELKRLRAKREQLRLEIRQKKDQLFEHEIKVNTIRKLVTRNMNNLDTNGSVSFIPIPFILLKYDTSSAQAAHIEVQLSDDYAMEFSSLRICSQAKPVMIDDLTLLSKLRLFDESDELNQTGNFEDSDEVQEEVYKSPMPEAKKVEY